MSVRQSDPTPSHAGTASSGSRHRFVFISGTRTWGGSEELWSATAAALASDGHHVTVFKSLLDRSVPRIRKLLELSADVRDLSFMPLLPQAIFSALARLSFPLSLVYELIRLRIALAFSRRPSLVVISQGGNQGGDLFGEVCRRMGLPYVVIAQKATDLYWPIDARQTLLRNVMTSAEGCFFVSDHNLHLTEEQIGAALPLARVVRNPFLVRWERRNDWPSDRETIRFACIGRLYPMEKGQDLILRVMSRAEWRARPATVTFFGNGPQRQGLERMARYLDLTSVTFAGMVEDVDSIWDDHHALLLPSRCEGLPLVVVEAMLSGRVPIVTNVAGSGEVVTDGVTGFLAAAATEDLLSDAMERAWNRRQEWPEIGRAAAEQIRTLVPEDPAAEFAVRLQDLAEKPARD